MPDALSEHRRLDESLVEERLTALEAARPWSPRVVSRLESSIRTGTDDELFRVNPLAYASAHGMDEREAIDLFLHATAAGLFTLDWLIVCGACSNVFTSFRKLETLDPHFVCSLCSNENEADLDQLIQVTFTVDPKVRPIQYHDPTSLSVDDLYFRYHFSADVEPLTTGLTVPETLRQWTKLLCYLDPGESRSVELSLPRSFVGVWDLLGPAGALIVAEPGGGDQATTLDLEISGDRVTDLSGRDLVPMRVEVPEGLSLYLGDPEKGEGPEGLVEPTGSSLVFDVPAITQIPTGELSLRISNGGSQRASAWVVQYPPIPDQGAFIEFKPVLTAKRLLSNQTFRRLFRSETVPASETLRVSDLTYLFTDLKDSTLMYDRVGDVNAYDLVRRHFDALVQTVADNSGAVVKTIGDAIMATFVSSADAVRAAIEMQSVLTTFNQTSSSELSIKIGIHRGRSIAVTLNDRIDYFGQDVNIAARVQHLAGPGEIVVSADIYESPRVAELLEPFEVTQEAGIMKGVNETVPVYRVQVPGVD